jgi:hypothetical protein
MNKFSMALLAGLAAVSTHAAAQDRTISVHNHLAEPVYQLNWSNTAEDDWGIDQLGDHVIMPSTRRTFWVTDETGACHFDFRVVTKSGRRYTKADVNVCEASAVEFGSEVSH